MLNIAEILAQLAVSRPIFHSEGDFQRAFASQLRSLRPDCEVRLEVPLGGDARGATDIVVRHEGRVHGIELKYPSKKFSCQVGGELFSLKAHGAPDQRRYDILKDIQRLERFNESGRGPSYVIVLTNDPAYWTYRTRLDTIDANFQLHEGRIVAGRLTWAEHAGAGSIKGREEPISLVRSYPLSWSDYSNVGPVAGLFMFLSIEIP